MYWQTENLSQIVGWGGGVGEGEYLAADSSPDTSADALCIINIGISKIVIEICLRSWLRDIKAHEFMLEGSEEFVRLFLQFWSARNILKEMYFPLKLPNFQVSI